ncbi:hypothetical protein Tco_0022995, partial [Tanacetum coccineum]
VIGLLQVVVYTVALKLESQSQTEQPVASSQVQEAVSQPQEDSSSAVAEPNQEDKSVADGLSTSDDLTKFNMNDIFIKLPQTHMHNLCSLLGHEGARVQNQIWKPKGQPIEQPKDVTDYQLTTQPIEAEGNLTKSDTIGQEKKLL